MQDINACSVESAGRQCMERCRRWYAWLPTWGVGIDQSGCTLHQAHQGKHAQVAVQVILYQPQSLSICKRLWCGWIFSWGRCMAFPLHAKADSLGHVAGKSDDSGA